MHRERSDAVGALPPGAGSSKVGKPDVDPARYVLSSELLEMMETNWQETMGARFGIRCYDEVIELLRQR